MDEDTAQRLMVVEPVVRRVVGARVPVGAVDDLVQATMERLADAAQRLTVEQLTGYAVVAGENASRSFHRTSARRQRLEHRLFEPDRLDGPEGAVLAAESEAALRRAMDTLEPDDAVLLHAHHVDGHDLVTLARHHDRTEMAIRVQLARARARLRVAYAVEHAGIELPSDRCRRVLDALSSGDRRAQERLESDEHLARCSACTSLVTSVMGRRRPAVALLPALALWWRSLSSAGRRTVSGVTAAVVVVAAVAAAAVAHHDPSPSFRAARSVTTTIGFTTGAGAGAPSAARPSAPTSRTASTPSSAPRSPTSIGPSTPPGPSGQPPVGSGRLRTTGGPLPSSPAGMAAASGTVTVTSGPVLGVPADEGFWLAADDGGRIWVQIVAEAGESPIRVEAGSAVSFTGRLVAHDPRFAGVVGVEADEGAAELTAQAHHVEVEVGQLRAG